MRHAVRALELVLHLSLERIEIRTDNVDGSLRVGQHAVAVFGIQLRDAKVEVLRQLIPEEGNAP